MSYELTLCLSGQREDRYRKRSSVAFTVRKIVTAPGRYSSRQPETTVSKGFTLSPGRLTLKICLSREMYSHGQPVEATVTVNNESKKTVKNIKLQIIQHVEVTMTNSQFTRVVSSLESREGCPITPGASLTKTYFLTPQASSNKRLGIALDGQVKDQDANLASSTMVAAGKNPNDALGIIVSYSLHMKVGCGAIGGELNADLPFKLIHHEPSVHRAQLRKTRSCSSFTLEDLASAQQSRSRSEEKVVEVPYTAI